MKCSLCKNPADTDYSVDRDKPKPLCSACFGRWGPKELDALLGVKPNYSYVPMATPSRPSVAGIALSDAEAAFRRPKASVLSSMGDPARTVPAGSPTLEKGEGSVESSDVFDDCHCAGGNPVVG